MAELFNRLEDHVHIARVLAQQHALELQRILFVAGVAHLAQPIHALVGVDAQDGIVVVAGHHGDANVGDLQVAGAEERIDGVFDCILRGVV